MVILIDEAVWGAPQAFADLGEVRTFVGRSVGPREIEGADALVVRSVTSVDKTLLVNSKVRFVGTASSGADHVDLELLSSRGIAFSSAEGCNARTVAEYVLAALLHLADRNGFDLRQKTLGVVGVGRIGSIVREWGRLLGMRVLGCDPPLARAGRSDLVLFEELAPSADIVTIHVPLTVKGKDATAGMVDRHWLAALKPGAMLINTSRGDVVHEDHLAQSLESGRLGAAALDVWRNEPWIDPRLAALTDLATPHVAGYSLNARRRAAEMIHRSLAAFLGSGDSATGNGVPTPDSATFLLPSQSLPPLTRPQCILLAPHILAAANVAGLDEAFRSTLSEADRATGFDRIRALAALREEFSAMALTTDVADSIPAEALAAIGFPPFRG